MKIQWFSNSPLAATGYGNQTRLFTPLIKQLGHDVSILAFYGHEPFCTAVDWQGITISGRGFHPYGQDVILQHYRNMKADICVSLLDAWVFDINVVKQMNWCPWMPIDHDPIPPAVLEVSRYAFTRLVYSKFGQKQFEERGLDSVYIPHGINTDVFVPLPVEAKDKARMMVGGGKLPADAFIVGMVAANKGYPSRKAFEENIAAFKMLYDKHNDAVLFLQTMTGENARDCFDIPAYCNNIGLKLGKNVFFCDQYMNVTTGFPDLYMTALYNSFDVLLSVSKGEGFGIPIMEAQACGCPVITGDWTSMGELTFGGWKVSKSEAIKEFTLQNSYQYKPFPEAIAERLELAYTMRGNPDYSKRARDGAIRYDVNRIAEKYWKPALENIAERLDKIAKLKQMTSSPVNLDVKEITA